MRHAILGAGGIGGFIGAILSAGGEDVVAVVRPAAVSTTPSRFELDRGAAGVVSGTVSVVAALAEGDAAEVLWVATKATQLREALDSVRFARPRAVVPLLNGIDHIAELRARFGEAVVPATIAVGVEKAAPGRFVESSAFASIDVAERGRAVLSESAEIFRRFGVTVRFDADETTLLWRKLAVIAPLALTTSAALQPIGFVRDDPAWRARLEAAVVEVAAVARAAGANVPGENARMLLFAAPPILKSSMLRDLEAGRPPEIDAIAGAVIRASERHGVPVDTIRSLAAEASEHAERNAARA
jgi:2-dehydropantoate 2-reductase